MKNKLLEKMKEQGINVSELSKNTGISRTTLTDIVKSRKKNITLKKALLISNFLNCSADEIFPELSKK